MQKQRTEAAKLMGKLVVLGLVVAVGILAWRVIEKLDHAPRTDNAYAYADTISVTPEVSGALIELPVKDNQFVKRGEVLFRVDPRAYQDMLARQRAALVALEKEIILARRAIQAQQYSARMSKIGIEQARISANQADDTLQRMEPLLGDGYIAAEQVDQARTAQRSSQVQLETALVNARRAEAAVTGVDALLAQQQVLKAEIALAELNLEHCTLRAPFDGRVLSLKTVAGQYAAAGHALFTLASTRDWYVIANFRETELEGIRPGAKARLTLMSDPAKPFDGTVDSIGYGVFPDDGGAERGGLPQVSRTINWVRVAQRFPVKIRVDAPDPELFRIGASAVAVLEKH